MTAPLALLLIRDNNRVRRAVLLFAGAYVGWFALTFRHGGFCFRLCRWRRCWARALWIQLESGAAELFWSFG